MWLTSGISAILDVNYLLGGWSFFCTICLKAFSSGPVCAIFETLKLNLGKGFLQGFHGFSERQSYQHLTWNTLSCPKTLRNSHNCWLEAYLCLTGTDDSVMTYSSEILPKCHLGLPCLMLTRGRHANTYGMWHGISANWQQTSPTFAESVTMTAGEHLEPGGRNNHCATVPLTLQLGPQMDFIQYLVINSASGGRSRSEDEKRRSLAKFLLKDLLDRSGLSLLNL